MLQRIRDNSKGTIAKVIVFFIAMTFALFGIETVVSLANQPDAPIEVDGVAINQMDIERAIEFRKQQLRNQFGDQIQFLLENDQLLREGAVEELINRQVLVGYSDAMGQHVSNQYISEVITQDPSFQTGGKFNQDQYVAVLRSAGYTPMSYQSYVIEQTNMQNLQVAIAQSEFVTPSEQKNIDSLINQQRDFRYTTLKVEDFKEGVNLSEEETKEHYKLHSARYQTVEQVSVKYLAVKKQDIAEDIVITEEELKQYYERFLAQRAASERREVAHILVSPDDRSAQEFEKRVASVKQALAEQGADFGQIAAELSDDPGSADQGGALGVVSRDVFPKNFENSVSSLQEGEVSGPVVTDSGTHFIKVLRIDKEPVPSFSEKRAELEEQALSEKVQLVFAEKKAELSEKAFEYDSVNDLAQDMNLNVVLTGLFGRNGIAKSEDRSQSIIEQPEVLKAVFSDEVLEDRQISDLIELKDEVVLLQLVEHRPTKLKPFDEVSESIRSELLLDKAKKEVLSKAETLVEGLQTGERFNLTWESVENVIRTGKDAVDRNILQQAFKMPKQDLPRYATLELPLGDVAIITLEKVKEAPTGELKAPDQNVQFAFMQKSYDVFQKALRDQAEVNLNLDWSEENSELSH